MGMQGLSLLENSKSSAGELYPRLEPMGSGLDPASNSFAIGCRQLRNVTLTVSLQCGAKRFEVAG